MSLSPYMQNILENTDIIPLVEGISRNTTSSIREYQKKHIPYLALQGKDNIMDDMYTFNGDTVTFYTNESYSVEKEDGTYESIPYRKYPKEKRTSILIDQNIFDESLLDYLYFDNNESKLYDLSRNTLIKDKYINLVRDYKIRKMMVFINNKFTPCSKLEIVIDYHYTYLLIDGISKEEIDDIKIIYLPKEVDYYENETRLSSKKLCFNSDGLLDMDSNICTIEFTNKDLEVEYFNSSIIESKIDRAKLTSSNIFTFTNGLLTNESVEEINYNTFKVNENVETFIFWNNLTYSDTEHIDKITNKELAKDIYGKSDNPITKTIAKPLDINYIDIPPKDYIIDMMYEGKTGIVEDVEKKIKQVLDYDRSLFNDLIESETISLTFTGLQLITTASDNIDGKYIISCPDKSTDSGMMMFVNGELYSLYGEIIRRHGQYYIPIDNIKSDDNVEFLFFTNVENLQYPFTPTSDIIDISLFDTKNIVLLAPYIHPRIIWNTEPSDNLINTLRFFVIGKNIVAVTKESIILFEDRGDIVYQTKYIPGSYKDAAFNTNNSNIFILTEDNIILNFNQAILRSWTMKPNTDGDIEFIEYKDGNLECKVGDKIYTIENVDGTNPIQNPNIKEATGTYIHNPYNDFNGTPYIFVTTPVSRYILKRSLNDLSTNKNVWYKIPYQKTAVTDQVSIDKKYINKELVAFSNKSFKYYGRVIDKPNISGVILPDDFSYCKNWNQFMVFINGRRLDQNSYAITTMKEGNPFIHTAVFPAIPLELNDRVDVFYLPRKLEDISTQATISSSGYIKVDHQLLPYGFNEDTCLIFLNGKKVRYSITKDVHFYKIKLNEEIGSLDHLNIVKVLFNDTYSKLLQGTPSEWDILMESVPSSQINKLMDYNDDIYTSIENPFNEYQATIKTPIYEILYHYFLSDPSSASDVQLYDFMDAGFDIAPNNMMVPGVFDATLQDKFKPL